MLWEKEKKPQDSTARSGDVLLFSCPRELDDELLVVVNLGVEMDCCLNEPILSKSGLGNPTRSAPHFTPNLGSSLPTTCTENSGFRVLSGPSFLISCPAHYHPTSQPLCWIRSTFHTTLTQSLIIRSLFQSFPPPGHRSKHFTRDSEAARESTDSFSARHSRSRHLRS